MNSEEESTWRKRQTQRGEIVNRLFFLIGAALMALGLAPAFAQEYPDRFDTPEACLAALESRQFTTYTPSFLSKHREPGLGEEVRPLEADACVQMHIVGSRRKWVVQLKGTNFIFRGTNPVAREDCGNVVNVIEYLPEKPAPAEELPPTLLPKPFVFTPPAGPPAPPPVVEEPAIEEEAPAKKSRFCIGKYKTPICAAIIFGVVSAIRTASGSEVKATSNAQLPTKCTDSKGQPIPCGPGGR